MQKKVVKTKYVGTQVLRKICFMFVFDTNTFSEPQGTFLNASEFLRNDFTLAFHLFLERSGLENFTDVELRAAS